MPLERVRHAILPIWYGLNLGTQAVAFAGLAAGAAWGPVL